MPAAPGLNPGAEPSEAASRAPVSPSTARPFSLPGSTGSARGLHATPGTLHKASPVPCQDARKPTGREGHRTHRASCHQTCSPRPEAHPKAPLFPNLQAHLFAPAASSSFIKDSYSVTLTSDRQRAPRSRNSKQPKLCTWCARHLPPSGSRCQATAMSLCCPDSEAPLCVTSGPPLPWPPGITGLAQRSRVLQGPSRRGSRSICAPLG